MKFLTNNEMNQISGGQLACHLIKSSTPLVHVHACLYMADFHGNGSLIVDGRSENYNRFCPVTFRGDAPIDIRHQVTDISSNCDLLGVNSVGAAVLTSYIVVNALKPNATN